MAGAHSVSVAYSGDSTSSASSPTLPTQTVNALPLVDTTTILSTATNPSLFGQPAVSTATVTSTDASPEGGVVVFKDGTIVLGTVNGTTQTGVRGATGLLLDGNGNPGSDYVAEINRKTLAGPAPGFSTTIKKASTRPAKHLGSPSATGFDVLAASGDRATIVHRRRR